MLDVIVGIAVFFFIFLGLREGAVKSLVSMVAVFVALFLATGSLNFLAKGVPQFSDPNYLGTSIVFILVWALSFIFLDLFLTLLFKKVIKIVILGPLDKVGGLLIGGFKGLLICGIILQLILFLPLPAAAKKQVAESTLSRVSIAVYHWAYPYAKRVKPIFDDLIKGNLKIKIDKGEAGSEAEEQRMEPDKFMGEMAQPEEPNAQEEKIKKLIKEQKILPSVPQGAAK